MEIRHITKHTLADFAGRRIVFPFKSICGLLQKCYRLSAFILFVMIACGLKPAKATVPGKTFESMKRHAVFLLYGHDAYSAFEDSDFKVIKVTNLKSSGEGSFAWAINQDGPRIVVFEVGGVIDLDKSKLSIRSPYLFVAGQTAPSPGITLIKGGINIMTHDVVIQHICVRPGDCGLPEKSGWETDGLTTIGAYNVLIDHCSFSWATDENLTVSGSRHDGADKTSRNITFSNCIIAEGLYRSTHSKVIHSMGTLIHDYCRHIAVVGNIYVHNNQRNPMLKPNATAWIVNNLIYNSKSSAIHATKPVTEYIDHPDSLRHSRSTIIGNVLVPGADTPKDICLIDGWLSAYQRDNIVLASVKSTNKVDKSMRIVSSEVEILKEAPLNTDRYREIASGEVVASVLKHAGARPKTRDAVDRRIVSDVKSGKGKVINSQEEVGGYPDYTPKYRRLSIPEKGVELWLETLSESLVE